jgi:hypothetical protein
MQPLAKAEGKPVAEAEGESAGGAELFRDASGPPRPAQDGTPGQSTGDAPATYGIANLFRLERDFI